MRIDIMTLFPQMFDGLLCCSIIGRAIERGLVDIRLHDIRAYTHDKHRVVDDYPYGGGAGMVLKPEPIFESVEDIKGEIGLASVSTILLSPQGRLFNQGIARELAGCQNLILVCGHYEGVDERVAEHLVSDEISIGDYLLSSGEVAAMVVVNSIARLLPGVLGSEESLVEESHIEGLLEYPQYTRPAVYRGWVVPEILLSGNHGEIAQWRRKQSLLRTAKRRPDLIEKAALSRKDKRLLNEAVEIKSEKGCS
jgi:tRNA (guanine37-N1)-methyltransferase